MAKAKTQKVATIKPKMTKSQKRDIIFYCILLAWPILQFCVFYIGVNLTSLVIGFRENGTGSFTFDYFVQFFTNFSIDKSWGDALAHSVYAYLITIAVSVPLALLFSYYIYKKLFGSAFFKIALFLPSILSALVLSSILITFSSKTGWGDFLRDGTKSFFIIMAFNIWMSFGTNVLMYSNAMSQISPEVIEASRLDGATPIHEFFHIILPSIYPTLTVFLIVGFAGLFVNQFNLLNFYGLGGAEWETIGYKLYCLAFSTRNSDVAARAPYAAYGVALTLIAVPFTYLVKFLLEKFGPSDK